jgi:hypothetical protein
MYFPADFSENYINQQYQPQFCNYKKECAENNALYSRNKPIDGIEKNIILSPRMLSTSKCNLAEYNRQCYLFPSKTETLIRENKNLDEKYCQQNIINIDTDSFLKNITVNSDAYKTYNIKTPVSNELLETGPNAVDVIDDTLIDGANTHKLILNKPTKRRNLIDF